MLIRMDCQSDKPWTWNTNCLQSFNSLQHSVPKLGCSLNFTVKATITCSCTVLEKIKHKGNIFLNFLPWVYVVLLHFVEKAAMFHPTTWCISKIIELVVKVYKEHIHCKTCCNSYFKLFLCSTGQECLYNGYSHLSTLNIFALQNNSTIPLRQECKMLKHGHRGCPLLSCEPAVLWTYFDFCFLVKSQWHVSHVAQ